MRRKLNVVVFRLLESQSDDPNERKQYDIYLMTQILNKAEILKKATFTKVVRVWKKSDSGILRPATFTLSSQANRLTMLKNARKIHRNESMEDF